MNPFEPRCLLERVPSHRLEQGSQYNVSHVPLLTFQSLGRELHTPTSSFYNFKSLNGVRVQNRHFD